MTDITKLAQRVKTEASAIDDTQWYLAKPSEIRSLVEALEAKDKQIVELNTYRAHRVSACINACEGISTENLVNNVPLKQGLRGLNQRIRDAEEKLEAAGRRIAELQIVRDKCFLSGLKTGWEYGINHDAEGYNREISDAQAVIDRAASIKVIEGEQKNG